MNAALIIPAFTTAITIGLGCGACCSPVISTFLSTYVISHAYGVKKGILSLISFFWGKLMSVSLICILASVIGRQFISVDGYIGNFNLRFATHIAMSLIGAVLVIRWIVRYIHPKNNCEGCHASSRTDGKAGFWTMILAGIIYGITPCAPLLLMIGYSITIPVVLAGTTGIIFSLSTMLSPILLLAVVTGALSKQMMKELPHYIKWFQLMSYIVLMIVPFMFKS